MEIVKTIAHARAIRASLGKVAFVPTMGALHAGHLSLIEAAKNHAPTVGVSIFVNPTQFGPREDYTKYPRPIEADLEMCEKAGVRFVFHPAAEEMYPPAAADCAIDLPALAGVMEGKHRPGHFKGVCQVVAKLFNILTPNVACFGQKDFQQLRIIQAMVEGLNMPIEIIGCPTLRDPDGLAMSSRNMYLSAEDRQRALAISRSLMAAQAEFKSGINQTNRLTATIQKILLELHLHIDYIVAVDPITLKTAEKVDGPTLLAIAARVGNTRLIDNVLIGLDDVKA